MNFLIVIVLISLFDSVFAVVECPDKTLTCPDETTCCPLKDSTYGCCPEPNAVCCRDDIHCCPHDTVCDITSKECIPHSSIRYRNPMMRKFKASRIFFDKNSSSEAFEIPVIGNEEDYDKYSAELGYLKVNVLTYSQRRNSLQIETENKDIVCTDGRFKCPSGLSCCSYRKDLSYCCPTPNSICCKNILHCCPEGTKCGSNAGECIHPTTLETFPWYKQFPATRVVQRLSRNLQPSSLPCASGYCESYQTCCSSTFITNPICCPFPEGVCCESGCCPNGFRCSKSGCVVDIGEIIMTIPKSDLVFGKSYNPRKEYLKICPDGSNCPLKSTCCPVENEIGAKSFQCCPLSQGMCCKNSCCPEGFHCAEGGICERPASTKDLLKELFFDIIRKP